MAGADISMSGILGSNNVYIFDNEPRNREITGRIEKHITSGESVVIWPKHIVQKDINDMFLGGLCVQNLVESNTYTGLTAKLKFNEWKK